MMEEVFRDNQLLVSDVDVVYMRSVLDDTMLRKKKKCFGFCNIFQNFKVLSSGSVYFEFPNRTEVFKL